MIVESRTQFGITTPRGDLRDLQVAYIAGLHRGGSTFLQLLLAGNERCMGLGEIGLTIEDFVMRPSERAHARSCTCGRKWNECAFWGGLLPGLEGGDPQTAFRTILRRYTEEYPGRMLIDASKLTDYLGDFYLKTPELPRENVRVVFLVRDFRGWAVSMAKYNKGWKDNYLTTCYRWMYHVSRRLRFLRESGLAYLPVSYERLVFHTDREMTRICSFLGLEWDPRMAALDGAASHEIFGSPTIRAGSGAGGRMYYDEAWMKDLRPVFAAPMLLPVYRLNSYFYEKLASQEAVVPRTAC